jgi:hypothetical protein
MPSGAADVAEPIAALVLPSVFAGAFFGSTLIAFGVWKV